jgi:predicted phosphoribosyltransferase
MTAKLFKDREDAGRRLSRAVAKRGLRGGALVLGIPRGGVLVAAPLARELGLPAEALLCRKLRSASDHALPAGALAETGAYFLNPELPGRERPDARQLREQLEWTGRALAEEARRYRRGAPLPELRGRAAILVDDGAATGATIRAAARALRERGAGLVVIALPVAPRELLGALSASADELVVLEAPEDFRSIAHYYDDWRRPTEQEAASALAGPPLRR